MACSRQYSAVPPWTVNTNMTAPKALHALHPTIPGSLLQQKLHNITMSFYRRFLEWSAALVIPHMDIRSVRNE